MDSKEILRQYLIGAMKSEIALSELEKLWSDTTTAEKLREAAKARRVAGFIRRKNQVFNDIASEKDLCLNLRDLVLCLGRIKLTESLYDTVKKYGQEFDLICEDDCYITCLLHLPEWLSPVQYVKDVYALKTSPNLSLSAYDIGDTTLSDHTIFRSYKSYEQKLAVHTALMLPPRKTMLISLPTGGGKSLVTQMLASTSEGLTLVIVPTVGLAYDQYLAANKNLNQKDGIFCYHGDLSENERTSILSAIHNKTAKILFTSPESIFKNLKLFNLLDVAAQSNYLSNIVIDEAHIVPDWGVFFRPDFQIFSIILNKWRKNPECLIRTYLLSATLSDDVVSTLMSLFGSEGNNVQFRCDALRQEPRFYFQSVKSKKEQDQKTLEAMMLLPKPMVIYVLEPREAKDLQKLFRKEGYKNIPVFTGETKDEDRKVILKGWKNNKYDVIIATSAFGIGVDKPDVRTILHACCPENLSRFYQEVGRAGRDGLPSISLLMPYQSKYDKEGDVHRALGLVNKRVLTVERTIIRWQSMMANPSTLISDDECIVDTATAPSSMTDEEAEYTGNRNIAWNVNLLLFLYRTGFIDLLDANYDPLRRSYIVKLRMLHPEILSNADRMKEAFQVPREQEYQAQKRGYNIIKDLIATPRTMCWGRAFKHLFPLSKEVCNGCPADTEGKTSADDMFQLRIKPDLDLPPIRPSRHLDRLMGSYSDLIVSRTAGGPCSFEEISLLCQHIDKCGIGVVVLPNRYAHQFTLQSIILTYDEFYFTAATMPYLFAKGVLCVFENDANTNLTLFKNLERLNQLGYKSILYCSENSVTTTTGKCVRESIEGYTIPVEKL